MPCGHAYRMRLHQVGALAWCSMTVAELIEWLKTQDQGATVEVIQGKRGRGYDGGDSYYTREFTTALSDYTDMRGNPYTKPDASYYNQRTLLLGEMP